MGDDIIVKILLKLEKDLLSYRIYILSNDIKSMSLPIDNLNNRKDKDKNKIYPFKVNALITDKKITTMTSYDSLKLFDDAWGIRSVVDDEIIWQNNNKLKSSTDSSSGLALMELFTYDCLDYNTKDSIIYNNKLSRDFINGKRCVSYEIKSVTILLLLFFDVYLLFSTMNYGLDRGLTWQLMWLFSIIIIIIMDIIFKQTTEEVLLGFIIPNSIRMKILNVINLI